MQKRLPFQQPLPHHFSCTCSRCLEASRDAMTALMDGDRGIEERDVG